MCHCYLIMMGTWLFKWKTCNLMAESVNNSVYETSLFIFHKGIHVKCWVFVVNIVRGLGLQDYIDLVNVKSLLTRISRILLKPNILGVLCFSIMNLLRAYLSWICLREMSFVIFGVWQIWNLLKLLSFPPCFLWSCCTFHFFLFIYMDELIECLIFFFVSS